MEEFTARVLVFDSDPDQRLRIIGRLGDRGYSNLIARSVDEALDIARNNQLDSIIVNASAPKKEQEALSAALKDLWETRHLPIILIGGDEDGNQPLDERDAALADFLPKEFHDLELFSHLSSLVRLKTMQSELERRLATTVEFGGVAPKLVQPPRSIRGAEVLAVACTGDERKLADAALGRTTKVNHRCGYGAALKQIVSGDPDAIIVALDGNDEEGLQFFSETRSNSRFFNTPLVLITDARDHTDPVAPYMTGANDVIPPSVNVKDLRTRVTALIKQRLYRESMRELYLQLGDDITAYRLTGLYTHGFLYAHLARQLEDANRWNKNIAVGYIDVEEMVEFNEVYGPVAGDFLLRELGALIGGLVRGEDLVARVSGEEFCVVKPDTTHDIAEFALERIVGVIGNTEFRLPKIDHGVKVNLTVGHASLQPGDNPEDLIARAREVCKSNRRTTLRQPKRRAMLPTTSDDA